MADQPTPPCPLCGCRFAGGHACSTVPAPVVPVVVDHLGRGLRAVVVPRDPVVLRTGKTVRRQG